MSLRTSGSQTVGPYLRIGLDWLTTTDLAPAGVAGERISVGGVITDGDGQPVPDAIVEIWQANSHGRYAHPADTRDLPLDAGFTGFGRAPTDAQGGFRFTTIKPGAVPGPDGSLHAPHINVTLFMRGMLRQLVSRIYFPGDAGLAADPALLAVPAARRGTLVAHATAGDPSMLTWNVVLQGRGETVFFDA